MQRRVVLVDVDLACKLRQRLRHADTVELRGLHKSDDQVGNLLLRRPMQIRERAFRQHIAGTGKENILSCCMIQTCVSGTKTSSFPLLNAGKPLIFRAVFVNDAPDFFRRSVLYCDDLQIPERLTAQRFQCLIQLLRLIVYWYDY